jgi:hypothetical protein
MKSINIVALLGLAVTLVLPGVPLKADDYSGMTAFLVEAAKAGKFSTLTMEPFGNYDGAGAESVRYVEQMLALGLINEKGLKLLDRSQFKGVNCYPKKTWFSGAAPQICPQAVIKGSVFKTPEGLSLMVWLIDASDGRVFKTGEVRFEEIATETSGTAPVGLSASGKTPALPGDFRDAPAALQVAYAAPLQVYSRITEGASGLKTGCLAAESEKAGFSDSASAVDFEKRTFKMMSKPDPAMEESLAGMLSDSYDAAVRHYAGDRPMEIGFTYSLAPRGAVYPFSEIEVSCIMQSTYARCSGPEICGDFFRELGSKIKRALPELLARR